MSEQRWKTTELKNEKALRNTPALLEYTGVVGIHQRCWNTPALLEYTGIVGIHQRCWNTPALLEYTSVVVIVICNCNQSQLLYTSK